MASRKYPKEFSATIEPFSLDVEENRIFCDHCQEYVHRSTYWRHQSLLDPATEHVTTFDDIDSNENSSVSLSETIHVDQQCNLEDDIPREIITPSDAEVANDASTNDHEVYWAGYESDKLTAAW